MNLRGKIFWGFLLVTFLTMLSSSVVSYILLKNNALEENSTKMQKKANAIMASLDYAIASKESVKTAEIPLVLQNKILEIADINKQDIFIYDLQGRFLLCSKDERLVDRKDIDKDLLSKVLKTQNRVDIEEYDNDLKINRISSYLLLKDNFLEPIAVIYFPYYHDNTAYLDVVNEYIKYILIINLVIILFGVWLSWIVSRNLTRSMTKFSKIITEISLLDEESMRAIQYYNNDELGVLVKAYNRMIEKIKGHKKKLILTEKESAWREMAKQVAHEVKNPLTPMKLTMQNFKRKFDPESPTIKEDVKKLTDAMVGNIDLVARVADAFSQFAKLPERNDEDLEINQEIQDVLAMFDNSTTLFSSNHEEIVMRMDSVYLGRIITNLVKNAVQATAEERENIVKVRTEKLNDKIKITVEDSGKGIPETIKPKIFTPNFTSKSGGSGLGLAMVKKMVEDYQGEIYFTSEDGKGSVFTIELPIL
ncbi:MAG: two-component sensor histidine kinase [Flavobacteriales bacterium]|nr:MAG: two-component sensor histidine kinase [Flavobacteriales bacterium]